MNVYRVLIAQTTSGNCRLPVNLINICFVFGVDILMKKLLIINFIATAWELHPRIYCKIIVFSFSCHLHLVDSTFALQNLSSDVFDVRCWSMFSHFIQHQTVSKKTLNHFLLKCNQRSTSTTSSIRRAPQSIKRTH